MKIINAASRRVKSRFVLPFLLLGFFVATFGISLTTPFIQTASAGPVADERLQKDRTILTALVDCMARSSFFWQDTTTASQVNNATNLSIFQSDRDFAQEEVPVGYEIDTGNGNVQCSKISLERALNFIDKTPRWLIAQAYNLNTVKTGTDPRNGDEYKYYEKKPGNDVIQNIIDGIESEMNSRDHDIGAEERRRRIAKAFWLCNEEVPAGQLAERGSNEIGGKTYQYREGKKKDNTISVGMDMDADGKFSCYTLLNWGNEGEMAAALGAFPRGSGGGGGAGDADAAPPEEIGVGCEESGILAWLACPMVTAMTTAVGKLDNIINTLLTVDTSPIFCIKKEGSCSEATSENIKSSKAYYKAWSSFRTIALGIIIIAALVIIISSAFGYEILDAYTLRKVLPRILIAVIFITLSWSVLSFLITLTNDVGNGVRSLIYRPFIDSGMDSANISSFTNFGLIGVLGGAAFWSTTALGALSFVATALLAVLIAFFILVLRELIIIVLVLLAPVAIACLVLPNTRKMWQLWQTTLTAMLVVFPIIAAMIAAGRVFSVTTFNSDGDLLNQIISLAAYILPYFLLPFAFRMAGGVMATLGGLANDRSRGGFDRLKKYREGEREYKKDKHQRSSIQRRSNINSKLQKIGSSDNATWAGRVAARSAGRIVGGRNIEALASAKRAAVKKEVDDQIATGQDDEVRALTVHKDSAQRVENGVRQYQTLGGAWVNEAQVKRARQRWGNDSFAQQAALSYEMRKASTEDQLEGVAKNYGSLAQSWGMNKDQANGTWIGSAFEHQNQHLEYKNMRMQTDAQGNFQGMEMDQAGYGSFATEVYEKRGSYQMAQMGSHTFTELEKAYIHGDAQTKQKVKAIAETFMSRYGAGGVDALGDDGNPIPVGGAARGGGERVTTNTPGAAHVAERVRQLAVNVGVYQGLDPSTDTQSSSAPPTIPRQN